MAICWISKLFLFFRRVYFCSSIFPNSRISAQYRLRDGPGALRRKTLLLGILPELIFCINHPKNEQIGKDHPNKRAYLVVKPKNNRTPKQGMITPKSYVCKFVREHPKPNGSRSDQKCRHAQLSFGRAPWWRTCGKSSGGSVGAPAESCRHFFSLGGAPSKMH